MRGLVSFKSLSKPSKHFPISPFLHSNLSQNSISHVSKNADQLTLSLFFQSHSISNSFRAWRPLNACSQPFSAVLKEPILAKYKSLNTHLPLQGASFFRRVIRDGRERYRRYGSELSRPFEITWNFWRFRMPTVEAAMWSLIGANVAVFMLWTTMDPIFMMKNFMISWENFVSGRIHTLITCAFSQKDLEHLCCNMFNFYFFGTSIGNLFGTKFLLKLYLAGAIGGSVFFLAHKDVKNVHGLGASGAVNAFVLLRIFLFPKAVHKVHGFIPVPATLLSNSGISGEAHLGGAAVAVLAWARIRRGWI